MMIHRSENHSCRVDQTATDALQLVREIPWLAFASVSVRREPARSSLGRKMSGPHILADDPSVLLPSRTPDQSSFLDLVVFG
jgi:chloramphenicol O-acetyltransferase